MGFVILLFVTTAIASMPIRADFAGTVSESPLYFVDLPYNTTGTGDPLKGLGVLVV
jgi:hypothetical protein